MSEIKQGKSIITDTMNKIHKTNDGITCCGKIMRMITHIDGTDFYSSQYLCECGNNIETITKRDEDDFMI